MGYKIYEFFISNFWLIDLFFIFLFIIYGTHRIRKMNHKAKNIYYNPYIFIVQRHNPKDFKMDRKFIKRG